MVNENLQRCLTIEPPEPALKLETLSEIAQVRVCSMNHHTVLCGSNQHCWQLLLHLAFTGGQ
jgi:hypothetical protein